MEVREVILNKERNVKLVCYTQRVGGEFHNISKRPAMLVLPGGGYSFCSEREGDPVAFEYLKSGFQAFILYYTVGPKMKWPEPLNDYDMAVEYIKEHQEEFGVDVDRICCVGFSAGGHLASVASCLAKNRPAVAVLGYPAVKSFIPGIPNMPDFVDGKTSPTFIFGTCNDELVPADNLVDYMVKLNEFGITYESHIYSAGSHGCSTCDTSVEPLGSYITRRLGKWVEDSIGFIREILGDFSFNGYTEPFAKKHVNGNYEEYLNLDCTLGHIYKNEEAKKLIEPLFKEKSEVSALKDPNLQEIILNMPLKMCLVYARVEREKIEALSTLLCKIKNK